MKVTRKVAGYLLVAAGLLLMALHFLDVLGGDASGFPTFLGIGVIFLIFGLVTTISCMLGDKECDVEAP
jgi:hypothetical protein